MPRISMTVSMLESMRNQFVGDPPDTVLEIEESTGTDAYGMIVRWTNPQGEPRKMLVTDYGAVRIA